MTPRRVFSTPVAIVFSALVLSASILVGSFAGASGDSHDDTYYACLYAGSLSQVNTTAPPANCKRGTQIKWSSFGGTIDPSMIEDGSIDKAKLSVALQSEITCGAFPHSGVNWTGCNLDNANLSGAALALSSLDGALLTGAILTNANLRFASLIDADLLGATLTGASLRIANLTGANLTGANLTGAEMIDANLTGVTWDNTTCPDGSNSDAADGDNFTCLNNL